MLLPTMWALIAAMSAHRSPLGGAAVGAANPQGKVDADHYATLNVSPSADAAEIRAAYRRAALFAHPDKGGTSEAFHLIAAAFNVLSCPCERSLYDQQRGQKPQLTKRTKGQKRACSGEHAWTDIENAKHTASLRMEHALGHLRVLLQQMDKTLRFKVMSEIPLRVQKALIDFIKKNPEKPREKPTSAEQPPRKLNSGCTRLQTKGNGTNGSTSKAQLDIEHLRFYTRWTNLESAIESQLILAKVQDRIVECSAADTEFWDKPQSMLCIFEDVLAEHGIHLNEFGVSVYVEMRAPEWVASCHHITSSVLPISDAVALRSRLLRARSISWDRVREEWLKLLQGGKNSCSLDDAERRLREARCSFLEEQVPHLVKNVERALGAQDRVEIREKDRRDSREKRRASKEAMKVSNLRKPKTNLFIPNRDDGDDQNPTLWPRLSAKRLRAHDRACVAAQASTTEAELPFFLQSPSGMQNLYS